MAMLLAFCLVSASMWSYGAEATADVLSNQIAVAVVGDDYGDHLPAGNICNHGCHAQSHLTGLDASVPSLSLPDVAATFSIEGSIEVPTQPCAGPFRPPRTAFQA